jgi:hypothetical protein
MAKAVADTVAASVRAPARGDAGAKGSFAEYAGDRPDQVRVAFRCVTAVTFPEN